MNLGLLPNPWVILGIIAALSFSGYKGYSVGVERAEARYERELIKANEEAAEAAKKLAAEEAVRLAVEEERDKLAKELEDAARADPSANSVAIGADSVRRLNRY